MTFLGLLSEKLKGEEGVEKALHFLKTCKVPVSSSFDYFSEIPAFSCGQLYKPFIEAVARNVL